MSRKPHVYVEQHYYLYWVKDYGTSKIEDFVAAFDVSPATAKRKADGLVAQGKLKYDPNSKEYSYGYE